MNKLIPSTLILIFLLQSSCSMVAKWFAEEPKVTLQNVTVHKLSFAGLETKLTAAIENPNSFALTMENLYFDVQVNDNKVGQGKFSQQFSVPAQDSRELTIPINFDGSATLSLVQEYLKNPADLNARVIGTITFSTPIGSYDVAFDEEKAIVNNKTKGQ